MLKSTVQTATWALRLGCAAHFIHANIYDISLIHGESMIPTINYTGDSVHVNKLCRRGRDCGRGDLIVASKPTDPSQRVCKRITGMPGDIVLVDPSAGDYDRFIQVPEGHCWVTGDNLPESLDSRSYGPLPMGLIKGKIIAAHNLDKMSFRFLR
ncbi:mitochondrial inner membrane protease subunit 1 [Trichomonascus vanleenenianus]|uniref:endopeptidase catalytic subunit IMP1 n=1 Tax=Trichomonascus vanleenenianus TaxID=2268995 RepID=UPI003ECBAD32